MDRRSFLGGLIGVAVLPLLGRSCRVAAASPVREQNWQSTRVHYGADGGLVYAADAEGHRIPDFSWAGYRNRAVPLPDVPIARTLSPIEGDNTGHIQVAIDQVGSMPRDANGFRGALLLEAGAYIVAGTLYQPYKGVVLRGVGDGGDPASNTIIQAVGNIPEKRTVLVVGGGRRADEGNGGAAWREVPGTRTPITTGVVQVGARRFEVADASGYAVGDNIIVYHPCTEAWLQAVNYGETAGDEGWTVGSQPILYNRYIKAVDGNTLTVGAPVYNHLDRSLAQSYIYTHDRSGIVTHVGVENLRVDIRTEGGIDEDHAWNAIGLVRVEDAWVRGVTALHFGYAGVFTDTATRVTIEATRALDPISKITGGRRYNFAVGDASNQILVQDTVACSGRHHYVSNGTSTVSGIVFHDVVSEGAYTASEGHRRWTQGMLYDHFVERNPRTDRPLALYNRGSYGTGHGWAAAHSVAWNSDVGGEKLVVQKPPTAQNYAIGCFGHVTGEGPFDQPVGYIEGENRPGLVPNSLYTAQLSERLGAVVSEGSGRVKPE